MALKKIILNGQTIELPSNEVDTSNLVEKGELKGSTATAEADAFYDSANGCFYALPHSDADGNTDYTLVERDELDSYLKTYDNATSATKLANIRYINGAPFDGSGNVINYVTCSTAAATTAKTVLFTRFSLLTGAQVRIKFTYANTASAPTLNVGSSGAKRMQYNGQLITNTNFTFSTNKIYTFTYNGTYWVLEGNWDEVPTQLSDLTNDATAIPLQGVIPIATNIDNILSSDHTIKYNTEGSQALTGGYAGLYYLMCNNTVISQPFGWFGSTPLFNYPIKVHPLALSASAAVAMKNTWQDVFIDIVPNTSTLEPYILKIYDSSGTEITSHNLANCHLRGVRLGHFG